MFKSYKELKAEQERLAAIENNMWKLPNSAYKGWFKDEGEYSRTLSGTLPSQTEPTGTLELKEEWLEGIDLDELLTKDNESN